MTLHTQFMTMGAMIVGGMYVGFANETFRRFVPLWQRSNFLIYSLEILFWLLQTSVLYYVLYRINYGELRLYLLFALISGFLLYLALFQKIYIKTLNFFINIIRRILITLYKLCMLPIVYISRFLIKVVKLVVYTSAKVIQLVVNYIVIGLIKLLLPKKVYKFISKKLALCSTMVHTLYKRWVTFYKKIRR